MVFRLLIVFLSSGIALSGSSAEAAALGGDAVVADVAVIGGGSAGFAAAWSAAKLGSRVALIEKNGVLGGTSTAGGVSSWEPVVGATGVPYRVYRRLRRESACGVYVFDRHCCWRKPSEPYEFPGGILKVDMALPYSKTLRRHGPGMGNESWFRENCHGVIFNPDAMAHVMETMLRETGRCEILLSNAFVKATTHDGVVESVTLADGRRVRAKVFIDAASGALCRQLGCVMMSGRETKAAFGEPGAPDRPSDALNGVTLMYRVRPIASDTVDPLPDGVPAAFWWGGFPYAFVTEDTDGVRAVNMLPTMSGQEAAALGEERAYAECLRRVRSHWRWLQTAYSEFRRFTFDSVAPVLAWRETCRVRGEYVLTQHDLIAGVTGQTHKDIVALSDHPMDSHGGGGPSGELKDAYGIPYRCLLPVKTRNVLVAGRCASFSSIAASSCRLSRTMMQLGEAAGVAAHVAVADGCPLRDVSAERIRVVMASEIDLNPFAIRSR